MYLMKSAIADLWQRKYRTWRSASGWLMVCYRQQTWLRTKFLTCTMTKTFRKRKHTGKASMLPDAFFMRHWYINFMFYSYLYTILLLALFCCCLLLTASIVVLMWPLAWCSTQNWYFAVQADCRCKSRTLVLDNHITDSSDFNDNDSDGYSGPHCANVVYLDAQVMRYRVMM